MKIIIASDSFKGTLSSLDICRLFEEELQHYPSIIAHYLPIADGGEGSLQAIAQSIKGRYISLKTKNPYFKNIETQYFIDNNNVAYLETASCAGLCLIKKLNPAKTTTFGLGQQVLDGLKKGCKKFYIFLGGSATNDGGCGLFSALGSKFYDKNGKQFFPTGGTLINISQIDNSATEKLLKDVQIIALCDVTNPLYGPNGAAYVYAPQKGADSKMSVSLDQGLENLSKVIKKDLGLDISNVQGSGAAGGLGGGLMAFGHGQLQSGIDTILNVLNFDIIISDADYIISGEGKLDKQSLAGKAIKGIASRCQKYRKKLFLIVGTSELLLKEVQSQFSCVEEIIETNVHHLPFENIKQCAPQQYKEAIVTLLKRI